MDLVGLLEVRGHLCEQLVGPDAYVDREAQTAVDLILEARRDGDGILPGATEGHVQEALVDAELLQDRGVTPADPDESLGTAPVPFPVTPDDDQRRTFAQGHRDGFGRLYAEFLGRDRRRGDYAPPVGRVSGDDGRNLADVGKAVLYPFDSGPGEEGGIDVDMEYDAPQHRPDGYFR